MSVEEPTDLQRYLILPRSGKYSDPRRNSEVLPLVYGDCTQGGSNGIWTCPCVDSGKHVYALAAHPVLTAARGNEVTVFDSDNQEISATEYSFNPDHDLEGLGRIATLTFTSDQSSAEPLSVRAKGKAEDGVLIQNPISVALDFLRTWALVGEEEIDGNWATRVKAALEGLGLELAGVITGDCRPDLVLSEMLRLMASWWRAGAGRLVFRSHLGAGGLRESDIVAHLGAKRLDNDKLKIIFDEEQICTRAAIYYGYNSTALEYEEFDDGSSCTALDMEARYGKAYLQQFELPWVRSPDIVAVLQNLITTGYGRAPALLQADLRGADHVHLEQGDVVCVSVDWLLDRELKPLKNQLFRLISVKCSLEKDTPGWIEAVDLNSFKTVTYPADGSLGAGGGFLAGGTRDRNQYS